MVAANEAPDGGSVMPVRGPEGGVQGLFGLPTFSEVLRDLREAFAHLSAAMDAIGSLGETGTLSVSVAPSFAAKWLLPRLELFEREHPEIDVHVSVSMHLADFARDQVCGVGLVFCAGIWLELVDSFNQTDRADLNQILDRVSGSSC